MLISFGCPVSGAWAEPETLTSIARRAEELGYHGLWAFQRLLVGREQDLAPIYQSVLDPIVALTWAGAATSRIRLGVSVINLPYLAPALLAKQVSTLDRLTGGRFDLGLGTGWSGPEFVATNADPNPRGRRTEEYLAALRTLFVDEAPEFAGKFYRVPPSRMLPRPVQAGGPPILLGGSAEVALRRAGRLAAGWVSSSRASLAEIEAGARVVREAAAEAGKDPAAVRVVVRAVVQPGERDEAVPLSGSWADIRAGARRYAEAGATELFYEPNWDPRIGGPDADPAKAAGLGLEMLEALAPE
ncbi:TIGR03619 family F420-dependent LLM class oxidoreductase [Actinoplanes regularis]|uniref:Probable F420-dependent oxidoreductase, Rv2161c family n=1 Tax=Actinoplanes regularis TaxID=52697 RepID=A0A238US46_9ACTN|nr:TIGR03619 family F420-dependent LLM class oxidoreductase [Actinoplanes regularis]GIE84491.1 LLM class F420-dependent oxidoreductase [Actinoplanes regularis]SNR24846.1 probable F420-dependent oxidoreductase, Rv2161c family [Actinoplanes regularis]